jgi:hypothetical protein
MGDPRVASLDVGCARLGVEVLVRQSLRFDSPAGIRSIGVDGEAARPVGL